MLADPMIEVMAEYKQRYQEDVVFPAAARRAQQEAELRLQRGARVTTVSSPRVVRRLVARLARFGTWSGSQGAAAPRS